MGGVYGYNQNETICLTNRFCAHDFDMILAVEQIGMSTVNISGILGLNPMTTNVT